MVDRAYCTMFGPVSVRSGTAVGWITVYCSRLRASRSASDSMVSRSDTAAKSCSSEIVAFPEAWTISPDSCWIVLGALPRGRLGSFGSKGAAAPGCSGCGAARGVLAAKGSSGAVWAPGAGAIPVARSIAAAAMSGEKPGCGAGARAVPKGATGVIGVGAMAVIGACGPPPNWRR